MSLILAIEPDARQSRELRELVQRRLRADLVHAPTTEGALAALAQVGDRVPDLVLVPSLLSPQEDAAIAGALRVIAAAANVRMLTIPLLARPEEPAKQPGMLARLRGKKPKLPAAGCDPDLFADQIAAYLDEAAAERKAAREELEDTDALGARGALGASGATGALGQSVKQTYRPLIIPPAVAAAPEERPVVDPPKASGDMWPDRTGSAIRRTAPASEPAFASAEATMVSAVGESLVQRAADEPPAVSEPAPVVEPPIVSAPAAEIEVASVAAAPEPLPVVAPAIAEPAIDSLIEAVVAAAARPKPEPVPAEEVKARFFASRIRIPKAAAPPAPKPPAVEPVVEVAAPVIEVAVPVEVVAQAMPVTPTPAPAAEAPAPVPVAAAASAELKAGDEIKQRASRSRIRVPKHSAVRKSVVKAKPKPRDEREDADVDALIAPLLTDMAAKRAAVDAPVALSAPVAPVASASARETSEGELRPFGPSAPSAPGHPDDVDPMFFAEDALTAPPPTPAQAERSAWLELVESLRQDIERLKAEKDAPVAPAAAAVEEQPQTVVTKAVSAIRRRPPADVVNMPGPDARTSRVKPRKPVQDQWGLFDPEQCGFAALLAKLDEIDSREEISA